MFELKPDIGATLSWELSDLLISLYGCPPCFNEVVKRRDWRQVVEFELIYDDRYSVLEYMVIRQVKALFEKNAVYCDSKLLEAQSLRTWCDAERLCSETNDLFRRCGTRSLVPHLTALLEHMRRYIQRVLGRIPLASEFPFHFGPGATTGTKKNKSCPSVKMAHGIVCSERLARSLELPTFLREVPHWTAACGSSFYIDDESWLCELVDVRIDTSRLVFVPKSYKALRSICIEPAFNGFLQQGIREVMETRMRRCGLQTLDQRPSRCNAKIGSLDGSIATIDLSSASDTIATELVRRILPDDWFRLLDITRSNVVRLPGGREVVQEKFCSMGNAFTFPLETLIFAAACSFWTDSFTVYGDDICVPTSVAGDLMRDLTLLGFVPNVGKSFVSGPFRESCGADYYRGTDIRPCYLRGYDFQSLMTLHNNLVKKFPESPELASLVKQRIPRELRSYGPPHLGDCCLHSHIYPSSYDRKLQARKVDVWLREPNTWVSTYPGDWVTPLYSVYALETKEREQARLKNGRPVYQVPGGTKWVRKSVYI